ncbi:MAG: single-stranded DNA-binding protein [Chitinophagaceae bacterium]|nr:single-stranded DNA-binding protein [Chitinophagaceae bacterium]
MKTRNKVELIGYLGSDPKVVAMSHGKSKVTLRLATDFYYRDDKTNLHRETTWHEITVWDKLAETVIGNFIKGSHVLVEGRIEYRSFTDIKGRIHHNAQVRATTLINLDR